MPEKNGAAEAPPDEQKKDAGREVELWNKVYADLAPEVRETWAVEQIKTIYKTVGKGLDPFEFQMGMGIAAKYQLDPLLKEIWFAKGKTRDGEPGRLLIMVGRDGLLRNARRDVRYRGFDCDVVHANDEFEVVREMDGERKVRHAYKGGTKDRGPIVGAWCIVTQDGMIPSYFFAPWEEYFPGGDKKSPWKTQPSVMIQKCALSLCLRLAFNLSGVVGEDEGAAAVAAMSDAGVDPGGPDEPPLDVVPEDMREDFARAWARATRVAPNRFTAATAQMRLGGQSPEVVARYIDEMVTAATQMPDDRDTSRDRTRIVAPESEEPVDAEVVDDEKLDDGGIDEDVEDLRRQLSDLMDERDSLDLEDPAAEAQAADLAERIGSIEERLVAAGGEAPGQEGLFS